LYAANSKKRGDHCLHSYFAARGGNGGDVHTPLTFLVIDYYHVICHMRMRSWVKHMGILMMKNERERRSNEIDWQQHNEL
jgi:hypothetical protein